MSGASLWLGDRPLLLASRSAGRRQLLAASGIPVEAVPADIDERACEAQARAAGADARAVALALAAEKAAWAARKHPDRIVLGADQTLDLAGEPLHKVSDADEAYAQLRRMAGREHRLHSAQVLRRGEKVVLQDVATATLAMRPLSEETIRAYVAAAGPAVLASVGCYQLEGLGIHLFERIEGDHSTIVGLPLLPLLAALRHEGLVVG